MPTSKGKRHAVSDDEGDGDDYDVRQPVKKKVSREAPSASSPPNFARLSPDACGKQAAASKTAHSKASASRVGGSKAGGGHGPVSGEDAEGNKFWQVRLPGSIASAPPALSSHGVDGANTGVI